MDKEQIKTLITEQINEYTKQIEECNKHRVSIEQLKEVKDKQKALHAISAMLKLEQQSIFYQGAVSALTKLFEELE
jgi:hypothetical protein